MFYSACITFFSIMFLGLSSARAELDIGTEVLLEEQSGTAQVQQAIHSGRYQIKESTGNRAVANKADPDGMTIQLKKLPRKLPEKKTKPTVPDKLRREPITDAVLDMVFVKPVAPANTTTTTIRPRIAIEREQNRVQPVVRQTTTSTTQAVTQSRPAPTLPVKSSEPATPARSAVTTEPKTDTALADKSVAPVQDSTVTENFKHDSAPLVATEQNNENIEEPTLTEQLKSTFNDQKYPGYVEYVQRVHPDDQRLNRLEIAAKTGVLSDRSLSNYSFRDYSGTSPYLGFEGQMWLTPFMGIKAGYSMSLSGDVSGPQGSSRTSAKWEFNELSFDLRKYYGLSRRANVIQYGVHYFSENLVVPGDNTERANLKSSGFGFHFYTRIPVAPSYSWTFGARLAPRFSHLEGASGINLDSGTGPESTRFQISGGGEIKFNRQQVLDWKLSWGVDKHVYSGQANLIDPDTGVQPSGVSVTNIRLNLGIGYRWGQ